MVEKGCAFFCQHLYRPPNCLFELRTGIVPHTYTRGGPTLSTWTLFMIHVDHALRRTLLPPTCVDDPIYAIGRCWTCYVEALFNCGEGAREVCFPRYCYSSATGISRLSMI
jgi:hypothetical protein